MENENQNSVTTPTQPPLERKKWYRHKGGIIILILAAVAVAVVLVLINSSKNSGLAGRFLPLNRLPSPAANFASTSPQTASSTDEIQSYIAGISANPPQARVLDDEYGIFMNTSGDQINQLLNKYSPTTKYKDDGIINSGQYAGYHRLAAFKSEDDPSGGYTYIFATKDYQTFILDTGTVSSYGNLSAEFSDPDSSFNKAKVVATGTIPSDFPANIEEGNFVLVRNIITWDIVSSTSTQLAGDISGLKFYAEPVELPTYGAESSQPDYQTLLAVEHQYLSAKTNVLVQDQFGLVYDYNFLSKEESKRLAPGNTSDLNFYQLSEINSSVPFYQEYGQLFPGGCGQANINYILQNISNGDLVKVATTLDGVDLYTLKDPNNPLNQEEYYSKITLWKDEFSDINNQESIPSYEAYVAKNPVLIFQDPWGRWVALGEWQYQTGGGCGKPVIYLYPTKPTEVTVKFLNPTRLTLDIPTYAGEWKILANPDGNLEDLRPQATDCGKINYGLPGSEYAQDACLKGIYPYLYWEGQASGAYPKTDGGWVVDKNDLSSFLSGKLAEIGLNEKEKSEMLSYWVPQLLLKNVPYYRLSFFQTQIMDNFIPMRVMPKPDTIIRVFLDWSPLTSLPSAPLQPEVLNHINRKGFTLVEWGGLKQ